MIDVIHSIFELQISHFANLTPWEELVPIRHFWQMQNLLAVNFDNLWSENFVLKFLTCEELVHFFLRCKENIKVSNFHKCEESVPNHHKFEESVPNSHIYEKLASNHHM